MKARLKVDKLIVESRHYTVETLNQLPPCLNPAEIATHRNEKYRGRGGTVNHGAQRIKAFISKSSCGNSVAASSVLLFRVTPFIN